MPQGVLHVGAVCAATISEAFRLGGIYVIYDGKNSEPISARRYLCHIRLEE